LDRPCCWRCREPWPSSSRHAYFRNEHQNTHTHKKRERHDNELFRRIIHTICYLFFVFLFFCFLLHFLHHLILCSSNWMHFVKNNNTLISLFLSGWT
jgi:hypothetical protein